MVLQSSCRKFHTCFDPFPPHKEDYSQVRLYTEPDQAYTLQEIMELSMTNQLGKIRTYDDYDDSEEGAEYEFGTDQFEYRQQLIDEQRRIALGKKKQEVPPPVDPPADPPVDLPA